MELVTEKKGLSVEVTEKLSKISDTLQKALDSAELGEVSLALVNNGSVYQPDNNSRIPDCLIVPLAGFAKEVKHLIEEQSLRFSDLPKRLEFKSEIPETAENLLPAVLYQPSGFSLKALPKFDLHEIVTVLAENDEAGKLKLNHDTEIILFTAENYLLTSEKQNIERGEIFSAGHTSERHFGIIGVGRDDGDIKARLDSDSSKQFMFADIRLEDTSFIQMNRVTGPRANYLILSVNSSELADPNDI